MEGFTGGDTEIQKGLNTMWADKEHWPTQEQQRFHIDPRGSGVHRQGDAGEGMNENSAVLLSMLAGAAQVAAGYTLRAQSAYTRHAEADEGEPGNAVDRFATRRLITIVADATTKTAGTHG